MANKWDDTKNGSIIEDDGGNLWRVVGYIYDPAVLLEPVKFQSHPLSQADKRSTITLIMSSPMADEYHPLKRAEA